MTATLNDLERWFDEGVEEEAEFMIVVCDTYDYENYPVYCSREGFWKEYSKFAGRNMQKVDEVYNLTMSREEQLKAGTKVFNMPE